jgi:hypothetical protein
MDKNTFKKLPKSRQFWTIIAIVVVNGVPALRDLIPTMYLGLVQSLLGIIAIYFRIEYKQDFKKK